jgi:hypothetical protein
MGVLEVAEISKSSKIFILPIQLTANQVKLSKLVRYTVYLLGLLNLTGHGLIYVK